MAWFSLEHTVKYYGLREGKQRLEKFVKYLLFVKSEQKFEKNFEKTISNNKGNILDGSRERFMEKLMFLLETENQHFILFSEAKSVPQVIFGAPEARFLLASRTFLCLPRRIAKSPVFYVEIMAFVDRKTKGWRL